MQRVRAAQPAGRRAAQLHMEFADRREIEHRVEGRDLEHADIRHAEQLGDMLDRLLRQPAAGLLLRAPQQRDHRRLLAAFRIFRDLLLRPGEILRREGEVLRLQMRFGEAADGHLSGPHRNARQTIDTIARRVHPNTCTARRLDRAARVRTATIRPSDRARTLIAMCHGPTGTLCLTMHTSGIHASVPGNPGYQKRLVTAARRRRQCSS